MKAQILKIAGVNNEKDFYKKFPTQEAFMAKHGAAFKKLQKAQSGKFIDKDGNGVPDYLEGSGTPYPDTNVIKGLANPFGGTSNVSFQQEPPKQQFPGSMFKPAGIPTVEYANQQGISGQGEIDRITAAKAKPVKQPWTEGDTKALGTVASTASTIKTGLDDLKAEEDAVKDARIWKNVSDVQYDAFNTKDVDTPRMMADLAKRKRYNVMKPVTGSKLFPVEGRGTTVKHGGKLQQGGEIMNTFAPGDPYQNLGYEPLGESEPGFQPFNSREIIKQFIAGGLIKAQQGDMMNFWGVQGQGVPYQSIANTATGMARSMRPNAGATIGGGAGKAIGSIFGMGEAGEALGTIAGGFIDTNPEKIKAFDDARFANVERMSNISGMRNFLSSSGYGEHGTQMSSPQFITHFGDNSMRDIFRPDPYMNTLRSGGNIRTNQVGDIEAISGGHLEPISYNPYSAGNGVASMIKGQSHNDFNGEHTGVLMSYKAAGGAEMEQPDVEAQRGELIKEIQSPEEPTPSAVVFGDIPVTDKSTGGDPDLAPYIGMTFQTATAKIAAKDKKTNYAQDKNLKELFALDPVTPEDKLKLNSFTLNEQAYKDIYKTNNMITNKFAQNQDIITTELGKRGWDAAAFFKGKIKPDINQVQKAKEGKKINKDINPPRGSKGNIDPNQQYQRIGQGEGALDYTGIGADNQSMFGSPEAYAAYKAETEAAYADPEIAKQLVDYFKNYDGPDWQDVRGAINKGRTFEEQRQIALGLATDYKPGRYHINTGKFQKAPVTPDTPATPDKAAVYDVAPYQKTGWETLAGQILPWMRKVPGERLQGIQLAGELSALSNNQVQPVDARFVDPKLRDPYDISFDDMLNENQRDFNQMTKMVGNNPEALAMLAAQKYGANQKVIGEEFRQNQAMKDSVYSGNYATLNEADRFNLGLEAQQAQNQRIAESRTKETFQEALNSIAGKLSQNQLENRKLQTLSNKFPDFSFDRNFRARKTGAPTDFNMPIVYNAAGVPTHIAQYDEDGNIIDYKAVTPNTASKVPPPPLATNPISGKKEKATARHGSLVKAFKNI